MIPIKQKTRHDCFRACVASILEFNIEDIPNFNDDEIKGWYDDEGNMINNDESGVQFFSYLSRLNREYLSIFNLNIIPAKFNNEDEFPYGYTIKSGIVISEGPAKGFYHAMVAFNGRVVHDPSPILEREYEHENLYYIFTCLDACIVRVTDNEIE